MTITAYWFSKNGKISELVKEALLSECAQCGAKSGDFCVELGESVFPHYIRQKDAEKAQEDAAVKGGSE